MKKQLLSKYLLYECSVQNPKWHVEYLPKFHRELLGKEAVSFREDFCGSGKISCEWVKHSSKNHAMGLDISPDALQYAKAVNQSKLTPDEHVRVKFIHQNVMHSTRKKFDLIGAYNFSVFALHERSELLHYFKSVYQSLKASGTFFLEVAGGMGFLSTRQKEKTITLEKFGKVRQIWEQGNFDPIASVNRYSIHFMLPNGKCLNDAFVYDWRIWQIRELREVLIEAGFHRSVTLWEEDDELGQGNDDFYPTETAGNAHSWIAYVIGVKETKKDIR